MSNLKPSQQDLEKCLDTYISNETSPYFLEEAKRLKEDLNLDELTKRFSRELEFGTGGMRGIIGAGNSYMNPYNIRLATQSLCDCIGSYKKKSGIRSQLKTVISFDSRHFSCEFAKECALVFAGNDFLVYLFREPRPTPFLSFSIRHLEADTGVMITASHNPPYYNGYKAYWNTGGQITPPHDQEIMNSFLHTTQIKSISEELATQKGLLKYIHEDLDDLFMKELNRYLPQFEKLAHKKKIDIVYTPLHGTGGFLIDKLFLNKPNIQVHKVKEQIKADGNFPTVKFPNPEEPSVYELGIKLGNKVGADIVIANDPDADRMGCQVKDKNGEWSFINGNQIGSIFLDYLLRHDKNPNDAYLINSIVTSDLQEKIAKSYGAKTFKTLTGFKWISLEMDILLKNNPNLHLALATEESYGFFIGNYVRDKDAMMATKLMTEIMIWLKIRNMSLFEYLEEIWERTEFYQDSLISKTFGDLDGNIQRAHIMERLREENLNKIGDFHVSYKRDYLKLIHKNTNGETTSIDSKFKTDAIEVGLVEKAKFSLRPSGTEPKIKMYLSTWGNLKDKTSVLTHMKNLRKTLEVFLQ